MHEEIRKHVELEARERIGVRIERVAAADENQEQAVSLISAHARSNAERHLRDMYDTEDASEAAAHARPTVPEFGALQTQRQLTKHVLTRIRAGVAQPIRQFDYTITDGSRIFGPPYDREWSEGIGLAFGARNDGSVITISGTGFSAAGIGFILSTNEPVLAAITPQGSYDWNWLSIGNLPFVRSRGGTGITIYADGQPDPTISRQQVLWDVSGATQWSGDKGSGRIADAASPAFGLGSVPLAPALLDMVPGSRYLVWVWCWQVSNVQEHEPFIAFMQIKMPFVSVSGAPPIILH